MPSKLFPAICFLYLLVCGDVRAQSPAVDPLTDSLEKVLRTTATDTGKANIMQSLADHLMYEDSAKALQYARQSLALFTKHKDHFGMALGHYFIGNVYLVNLQFNVAAKELMIAEKMLQQDSSRKYIRYRARVWHNYATIMQRTDKPQEYLDILLNKVVPLLEKARDTVTLAMTLHNIGLMFMNFEDNEKALSYYKRSIVLRQSTTGYDKESITGTYLYAARTLIFMEKYPEARRYLDTASHLMGTGPETPGAVLFHSINGMYYYYTGEEEQALRHFEKGLKLAERFKRSYEALDMLMGKYYVYDRQKNYPLARQVLNTLYEQSKIMPISMNEMTILKNLASLEEKTGNSRKAYQYLQQYIRLSDSVNTSAVQMRVNELEKKYEDEKKQKEILSLQNRNREQQLVLQRAQFMKNLWLISSVALLVLLLLVYLLYRGKKRLALQQQQLHQLSLLAAMLQGQEQERTRFARDLHDGLGGLLSGIRIECSQLETALKATSSQPEVTKIGHHLDNAVDELRRIARNMMPEMVLKYGLGEAVREYCQGLKKAGVQISCQLLPFSEQMSEDRQVVMYRILQELINNAMKHAGAGQILVQLQQINERFIATVEDDGNGFDIATLHQLRGAGLANVQARVDFLHGKMDVESQPGIGTTVTVECSIQ